MPQRKKSRARRRRARVRADAERVVRRGGRASSARRARHRTKSHHPRSHPPASSSSMTSVARRRLRRLRDLVVRAARRRRLSFRPRLFLFVAAIPVIWTLRAAPRRLFLSERRLLRLLRAPPRAPPPASRAAPLPRLPVARIAPIALGHVGGRPRTSLCPSTARVDRGAPPPRPAALVRVRTRPAAPPRRRSGAR